MSNIDWPDADGDTSSAPETSWAELMRRYYPAVTWLADDDDVRLAANEVKAAFGGGRYVPTNRELCDVVRWMSGPSFRASDAKRPSIGDLIKAVRFMRKEKRDGGESGDGDGAGAACEVCAGGWLAYYPSLPREPTVEDYSLRPYYAIPCNCAKGRRAGRLHFREQADAMARGMARMVQTALQQHATRERLYREMPDDGRSFAEIIGEVLMARRQGY